MYTWPCRQEHRHWPGVLLASLLLSVLRAHQIDEDELAHSQPQTPPPRGARGPPDPDDEEEARCHHAYIPLRRMVCGMRAGLGFCTGQDLRAVAEAAIAGMPSRIQDFQGAVAAAHAARCIANLALANADAADELVELWRCTQACSLRQPWARDQQGHMGRRCAGVGDGRARTHGGGAFSPRRLTTSRWTPRAGPIAKLGERRCGSCTPTTRTRGRRWSASKNRRRPDLHVSPCPFL